MGAKTPVSAVIEERKPMAEVWKPTPASVIMESMVATEAELKALWAECDQNGVAGSPAAKRTNVA